MAGFLIEVPHSPSIDDQVPLRIVSLGKGELLHTYSAGSIRALWSRWPESRQLFVRNERENLLWVEGQPDRLPAKSESLRTWLPGRWGSFRGFEVDERALRVTIFGDPLGTRPIFYRRTSGAFYISDKLASLATMAQGEAEVNWGALLEALVLGALYSEDTTLAGAEQLSPGVALRIKDGRASTLFTTEMPDHPSINPQEVLDDPSGSLLTALKCAVEEVWVDREAPILLSGGLDSRLILRLAGPGRKAMTVTTRENRESRIARRIAQTCGAEFRHIARPQEQYHRVVRDADLLVAAMYYPYHVHHLHMTSEWREQGVHALAHAFMIGMILKSTLLFPAQKMDGPSTFLDSFGAHVSQLLRYAALKADNSDVDRLHGLLSEEGQNRLRARLTSLAESFHSYPIDGLETALERKVTSRVSRYYYYPNLLGWIEEQDIFSPVFHPAIWSWFAACRPRDRYKAKAHFGALQKAGFDICAIPNANTGRLPTGRAPWLDIWNHSLVRLARKAGRTLLQLGPEDSRSWPPMGPIFRLPEGKALLEEGLAELERCPLFDRSGLQTIFFNYLDGNNRVTVTALALVGAARWIARVREGASV